MTECSKCKGTEFTRFGKCKPCKRAYDKKWREENPDKFKKSLTNWRIKNREHINNYLELTKERRAEVQKVYDSKRKTIRNGVHRVSNEINRHKVKEWKDKNKDRVVYWEAKRRAQKLKASPSWTNEFFVKECYRLAIIRSKSTGVKHHVDHIIPLRSKIVCGLHTHTNLQVIPWKQNLTKGNKLSHA